MTVIIGQNSTNKSHSHSITDPGHTHRVGCGSNNTYEGDLCYEIGTYKGEINTYKNTTGITINSDGGVESHPINITTKVWKRIS